MNMQEVRPVVAAPNHRGPKVFTVGLLGFMLCACAPVGLLLGWLAMQWGKEDLRAMDEGRVDREGYSLTVAGRILGIIAFVMSAIALVYWGFAIAFGTTGPLSVSPP